MNQQMEVSLSASLSCACVYVFLCLCNSHKQKKGRKLGNRDRRVPIEQVKVKTTQTDAFTISEYLRLPANHSASEEDPGMLDQNLCHSNTLMPDCTLCSSKTPPSHCSHHPGSDALLQGL